MDFGLEVGIFLAYACGILAICFFGRMLLLPVKMVMKLLLSSLAGGAVLLIINAIGSSIGFFLPINGITAVVTGLLGIPGIVGIIIFFNGLSLL